MINRKSKGQALLMVLLMIAALLAAGAIFIRTVFSERSMVNLFLEKEKAFYIARAGMEDGRATIAANPGWFTDIPHSPDDDAAWLNGMAHGSVKHFGGGSYKVVRESGKNVIYSVGYFRGGRSIMRIRFSVNPFKAYEFKIL